MVEEDQTDFSTVDVLRCTECTDIQNPCRKHIELVIDKLGVNPGKAKNEIGISDVPRDHNKYAWTDHASTRSGQRRANRHFCEEIISNGSCISGAGENIFKFCGETNGKDIVVVTEVTPEQLRNGEAHPIITVYRDDE